MVTVSEYKFKKTAKITFQLKENEREALGFKILSQAHQDGEQTVKHDILHTQRTTPVKTITKSGVSVVF